MFKIFKQSTQITRKIKFNYQSYLGQPVDSIGLNSIINSNIEIIKFFVEQDLSSGYSLILSSILFRFSIIALKSINIDLFEEICFAWEFHNTHIKSIVDKIFIQDFKRDVQFYNLSLYKEKQLEKYYDPRYIIFNICSSYIILNWGRSLNHIVKHHEEFSFMQQKFCGFNLLKYDDTFILPIFVGAINYFIIKQLQHPYLIHLQQDEYKLHKFNIAFMTALSSIFFPSFYLISYISFAGSHVLIRNIINQLNRMQIQHSLKQSKLSSREKLLIINEVKNKISK